MALFLKTTQYSGNGESSGSEMRGVAIFIVLGLMACATTDAATPSGVSSQLRDWQTPTGKPPTKHEFAAVVAACQDRAKSADTSS